MTQEERNEIEVFLKEVFGRIKRARRHIANCNYGLAYEELSKAYPELKLKVEAP